MKKLTMILIACFCIFNVQAQERSETITKRYSGNDFRELTISNRFGNIEVRQGGDVFEVQVVIAVQAKNQAKADEVMDYIRIEIDETAPVVQFKTTIGKDLSISKLFAGVTVDVDYRIRVPKGKTLRVANREGSITAGDYTGDLSVDIESGNFVARSVTGGDLGVKLSKGELDLQKVEKMNGEFRSATVKIGNGGELKLDCSATTMRLMESDNIVIKSSSGSCYIGSVENLNINSSYTKYEIQDVGGSLTADCRWGELNVRNIQLSFSQIDLKSSYTKVGLAFMDGAGYHLDLKYTKSVKVELAKGIVLEKKPTANAGTIFETGFVGDNKLNGKVLLNLSGGNIFIQ